MHTFEKDNKNKEDYFLNRLVQFRVTWAPGAYLGSSGLKVGTNPGQHAISWPSELAATCTSLQCERKPEHREKNPRRYADTRTRGECANST